MSFDNRSWLTTWGEELFYRPVQSVPPKRNAAGVFVVVQIRNRTLQSREKRIRKKLVQTVKRAPEVMVKISGSGKGMARIKAHLDYISRNGKVELENETGDIVDGRDAISDLQNEWRFGLYGIPEESSKREAFNIVLSMPPGTDRIAVTKAAREFAQEQFSVNHQYVFATHDDERHPHVHLCVKSLGIDGTRLNPRKGDLQMWREVFAEKLGDQGIEANATPRMARGILKSSEKQVSIHMRSRNVEPSNGHSVQKLIPKNHRLSSSEHSVVAAYKNIATEFAASPEAADRKLAAGIVELVKDMPVIRRLKDRSVERTADRYQATGINPAQLRKPSPDDLER